ncbi:MAG: hypothetical protein IJP27_03055 [Clostridia bacterium]|nr:hypothetical protein [Clostridia bacterium]
MNSSYDEFIEVMQSIYDALFLGYGIAEMSISGIILLIAVIGAICSAVFSLIVWILEAVPVYKLAKKAGRKWAMLAWVPIFGSYFRLYVLTDIPGNQELTFFGSEKFKISSRPLSFWIYVGIKVFGTGLITALIGILNLIPIIGQIIGGISSLLYLVPAAACGIMEYAYLRDVLNLFKPDQKANRTAAIVVTVLDSLATLGFARVIYLYTVLKYNPLPRSQAGYYYQ